MDAKEIYDKLKFYCDFHGLDFLNISENDSISNLENLINDLTEN